MKVSVRYFAVLREQANCDCEDIDLDEQSATCGNLYSSLSARHGFLLEPRHLRVAINDEYRPWDHLIHEGDTVVFIPPVAGG